MGEKYMSGRETVWENNTEWKNLNKHLVQYHCGWDLLSINTRNERQVTIRDKCLRRQSDEKRAEISKNTTFGGNLVLNVSKKSFGMCHLYKELKVVRQSSAQASTITSVSTATAGLPQPKKPSRQCEGCSWGGTCSPAHPHTPVSQWAQLDWREIEVNTHA